MRRIRISSSERVTDMRRELEICIDEEASAEAAVAGGADRLEVCASLSVGGLTPSLELVTRLRARYELPLHAMVRPRAGGFVYDAAERERMLDDVARLADAGCEGVVFGALTADGAIDSEFVRELVGAAGELHCTFHRAIDCLEAPSAHLVELAELGIGRVLSSGGRTTALEGAPELARMSALAPAGLQLMAGAGVHSGILRELLDLTGLTHVHGSAAPPRPASSGRVSFEAESEEREAERRTSETEVRAMRAILDGLASN